MALSRFKILRSLVYLTAAVACCPTTRVAEAQDPRPQRLNQTAHVSKELLRIFEGHTQRLQRVHFVPGTNRIVSTSFRETIVWDRESGEKLKQLPVIIQSVISPDGRILAGITKRRGLEFFDLQTFESLRAVKPRMRRRWREMEISPDGKTVVVADADGQIEFIDVEKAEIVKTLPQHDVSLHGLAFTPDAKTLIVAPTDKTLEAWDLGSEKRIRKFQNPPHNILCLGVTNDGRYVIGGGYFKDILVWELATGRLVRRFQGHIAGTEALSVSPVGMRAVSGSDDHLSIVWDLATGSALDVLEGHTNHIRACDISADGKYLLTGSGGDHWSGDYIMGDDWTVRLWKLPDPGKDANRLPNFTPLPDGPPGEVKRMQNLNDTVNAVEFSPNGKMLATGDDNHLIRLWDVATGKEIGRLNGHQNRISTLAFSPDGSKLVSGSNDKTIRLWDVKTRREIAQTTYRRAGCLSISFYPDNRRVIFGCWGASYLWDPDAMSVVELDKPTQTGVAVAVSPDSRYVATGGDKAFIRLWNADDGTPVREIRGHVNTIRGLAFTKDGRKLLSLSQNGAIKMWDVETGKMLKSFAGHDGRAMKLRLFSDSRRMVTTGDWKESTIRIWDIEMGRERWKQSNVEGYIHAVAVSPDGRFLATGNKLGYANIIRLPGIQNTSRREEYERARQRMAQAEAGWRVAVLNFEAGPLPESRRNLGVALAEMTSAALSGFRGVTSIERNRVQSLLGELELSNDGLLSSETLVEAGQALTADYLLSGKLSGSGDELTLKVTLQQPGDAQSAKTWELTGNASEISELSDELTRGVLESLGLKDARPRPPAQLKPDKESTVAITAFRNLSTEEGYDSMESGFADYLQSLLSTFPQVNLIERVELDRILREQSVEHSGLIDPETALKVSQLVGAERYIFGSYLVNSGQLTLIVKIADTETGSVVASQMESGPTDEFDQLMEKIGVGLVNSLSNQPIRDVGRLVNLAIPVKRMEVALYLSEAKKRSRLGKTDEALLNLDRALLIDPDNLAVRLEKLMQLYWQRRYEEAIELADATLKLRFTPAQSETKNTIYIYLLAALKYTRQHDRRIQVAREWAREFPGSSHVDSARLSQASSLLALGEPDAALALFESAIFQARLSGDDYRYGETLKSFYFFHRNDLMRSRAFRDDPELTRVTAEQVVDAVREWIRVGKEQRSRNAYWWGKSLLSTDMIIKAVNEDGEWENVLTDAEMAELIAAALDSFGWERTAAAHGHVKLSYYYERLEDWEAAVENLREYLKRGWQWNQTPPFYEEQHYVQATDWLDSAALARYQIGYVLSQKIEDRERGRSELQTFVDQYGLQNAFGSRVVNELQALDAEPEFSGKYALVWGGSDETCQCWKELLAPRKIKVHLNRRKHLRAADLLDYDLVIVVKAGNHVWAPIDMLGLQQYVAAGGSLLVVTSPAYDSAIVGINRSLLSMFGFGLNDDHRESVNSSEVVSDHPVTLAIPAVEARHAVGIEVPEDGRALVMADCGPVLAVKEYERGRIILTTLGQWLFPKPSAVYGNKWTDTLASRKGGRDAVKQMPFAPYEGTNARLLENSLDWLTENRTQEVQQWLARIRPARMVQAQFAAHARTIDELAPAYEQALSGMKGLDRELGLWLAAEAQLQMQYFPNPQSPLSRPGYGFDVNEGPFLPADGFFRRLIEEFPDSPRAGFARWRLCECLIRRETARSDHLYRLEFDNPAVRKEITQLLDSIPENSSPAWIWAQLRLADLNITHEQSEKAIPYLQKLVDRVPAGPDKARALLNLGHIQEEIGSQIVAKTIYLRVVAMPSYNWWHWGAEFWEPRGDTRGKSSDIAMRRIAGTDQ